AHLLERAHPLLAGNGLAEARGRLVPALGIGALVDAGEPALRGLLRRLLGGRFLLLRGPSRDRRDQQQGGRDPHRFRLLHSLSPFSCALDCIPSLRNHILDGGLCVHCPCGSDRSPPRTPSAGRRGMTSGPTTIMRRRWRPSSRERSTSRSRSWSPRTR